MEKDEADADDLVKKFEGNAHNLNKTKSLVQKLLVIPLKKNIP